MEQQAGHLPKLLVKVGSGSQQEKTGEKNYLTFISAIPRRITEEWLPKSWPRKASPILTATRIYSGK